MKNKAKFAAAAVEAIEAHHVAGQGIRPVSKWDDRDVIDSGKIFEALSNQGLPTTDKNERALEDIVSPIVFGAFHQDGTNGSIQQARKLLSDEGILLAELRWNDMTEERFCPITGKGFVMKPGYHPFVDNKPVSLSAFSKNTGETIKNIMSSANDDTQEIGGYFPIRNAIPHTPKPPTAIKNG